MIKKCFSLYKKYEEVVNYLIVGGLTTLVNLVSKWLLLFTILDAENPIQLQIAILISWVCAVSFAYVTNRIYVFKSKNKNIFKEIVQFFASRIVTLVIEMGIMWFFVTLLRLNTKTWVMIFTIMAQILIMILNYVFSKIFVFKKGK